MDWSGGPGMKVGKSLSAGLGWTDDGHPQNYIWKLAVAMEGVTKGSHGQNNLQTIDKAEDVMTCVAPPYALLVGNINITLNGNHFNVSCINCNLSNCMSNVPDRTIVMILHQPAFVMLSVNVTGPWYADKCLRVLEELKNALSRQKRVVGFIIAGIIAIVSLIATAATAAIALSHSVQTAHYGNQLSKNVTMALRTQEDIDAKVEQKLYVLYALVRYLGEEIHGFKIRSHLECHAE